MKTLSTVAAVLLLVSGCGKRGYKSYYERGGFFEVFSDDD